MSHLEVRNRNCVVALNVSGEMQASAVRVSRTSDWDIDSPYYGLVAQVSRNIPELLQRKLVHAILKEVANVGKVLSPTKS